MKQEEINKKAIENYLRSRRSGYSDDKLYPDERMMRDMMVKEWKAGRVKHLCDLMAKGIITREEYKERLPI